MPTYPKRYPQPDGSVIWEYENGLGEIVADALSMDGYRNRPCPAGCVWYSDEEVTMCDSSYCLAIPVARAFGSTTYKIAQDADDGRKGPPNPLPLPFRTPIGHLGPARSSNNDHSRRTDGDRERVPSKTTGG